MGQDCIDRKQGPEQVETLGERGGKSIGVGDCCKLQIASLLENISSPICRAEWRICI